MSDLHYTPISYPNVLEWAEQMRGNVEDCIRRLQKLHSDILPIPITSNFENILEKLSEIQKGQNITLSQYEKQCLAFHIGNIENNGLRTFFLTEYLTKFWDTSLISGCMYSLLMQWNEPYANEIRKVLNEHGKELAKHQKESYKYMNEPQSAEKLAAHLILRSAPVTKATDYVLLDHSMFTFAYFEDVMKFYYSRQLLSIEKIEQLNNALELHNSARFNKILLPIIIIFSDKKGEFKEEQKKKLMEISEERIGNIDDRIKWQDSTLKNEEKDNLITAHHILQRWQVDRIIDYVFTKSGSSSYPDRAAFWKKYSNTLLEMNSHNEEMNSHNDILFVCIYIKLAPFQNTIIQGMRKQINELKQSIGKQNWISIRELNQGPANTALLMRFGDKLIVELLEGGCMYLYQQKSGKYNSHENFWNAWGTSINSIDDVKFNVTQIYQGDVNQLGFGSIPNELRIAHQGNWQATFQHLLTLKGIQ